MSATSSTKLRTGLAEVFQTFGAEYLDAHGLTAPQAKVFRAVLDCRTAALGGLIVWSATRAVIATMSITPVAIVTAPTARLVRRRSGPGGA
jgi:hypothetical protein